MALRLSKEERDFPVCAEALPVKQPDDLSAYYEELLEGRYDCVDRIVLNGYLPRGQQGGAFRTWWRALTGSDSPLELDHLMQMAGRFSRRVHAWAKEHAIPLIHCPPDQRKHEWGENDLPAVSRSVPDLGRQGTRPGLGGNDLQERCAPFGAQEALALRQSLPLSPHRPRVGSPHHQDERTSC